MIIIYDFDGTLTPYSLPQYEILKKCGYNDETLMKRKLKLFKKFKVKIMKLIKLYILEMV